MKFIILFLISFSAVAGFPPTTLKGQSQSTATTTFNFQVPNNQATKTATGTLVETGSQNLLSNPGFEHSTVGTDWNVTSGTLTASGSAPFGSFSGTFSGSIANGSIQSLTGSGTAQAGLNCLVSAFVKTASSNVQLCAIHNGTLNTNLCVNVNPSNTWAQYQIPTVCDATSTVARVRITTSVSTTFNVDNVYVGINPNFGSVAQAQYIGTWSMAGAASCFWTTGATSFTTLTANASCSTPTASGSLSTNAGAKVPQFIMSGQAGTYKIVVHGGTFNYSSPTGTVAARFTDGTLNSTIASSSNSGTTGGAYEFLITEPSSFSNLTFSLQGRGDGTSNFYFFNTVSNLTDVSISVFYFPPASSIVTTNNQDYDWTAYTPTFTGIGTPTSVEVYHKRVGSDLLIKGNWTTGTVAASAYTMTLPSGLSILSSLPSRAIFGFIGRNTGTNAAYAVNGLASGTTVNFGGFLGSGGGSFGTDNGSSLCGNSEKQGVNGIIRIPIQGWNNNNVIVGTFAGVGNIKGLNNSVNEVMFGFGTTTQYTRCTASPCTIFENGSAFNISVTRSTTGIYQIVFPSDFSPTVKPKCWLTGKESSVSRAGYCGYQSTNPTNTTINLECRDGTSNIADVYMDVFCKGY